MQDCLDTRKLELSIIGGELEDLSIVVGPDEIKYYDREISYYQWTPLILVMQAFLFAFPSICWSFATHHAGNLKVALRSR